MDTLLEATTVQYGESVTGVGVDPLEESAGTLEALALRQCPEASILLAAVGEISGTASLFCLPKGTRLYIRKKLRNQGANLRTKVYVDRRLAYLENMSCIGVPHPDFKVNLSKLRRAVVDSETLLEERFVKIYTFQEVLDLHNAHGCEVLIIDAEGADCAILRSMIVASSSSGFVWPRVIRFETQGLADVVEHSRVEETIVISLQEENYLLLQVGLDVTLVHEPTLRNSAKLAKWADCHFTLKCYMCGWYELPSQPGFADAVGRGFAHWVSGVRHERGGAMQCFKYPTWCCTPCNFCHRSRPNLDG